MIDSKTIFLNIIAFFCGINSFYTRENFEKNFPNHNFNKAVQAGIEEDKFEAFLKRMLKKRAIVAPQQSFALAGKGIQPGSESLAEQIKKVLRKERLSLRERHC